LQDQVALVAELQTGDQVDLFATLPTLVVQSLGKHAI
jgi:hypothetical protein